MGLVKTNYNRLSRTQVLVIGTGAFAQGFASLAQRSGATASYVIRLGSRRVAPGSQVTLPELPEVPVCCIDDHLAQADMVVLATPASSLPSIVKAYGSALAGKVVVDVTNATAHDLKRLAKSEIPCSRDDSANASTHTDGAMMDIEAVDQDTGACAMVAATPGMPASTADWLERALPQSASVVKAFCNLSAYTLLHGDPLTEHIKTVSASGSLESAAAVADLGRAMGVEMRIVPSLSYAAALEARQHGLLPTWQWPAALMFGTWLVVHIYSFIRYCYFGGSPWENVTMWVLNKSVGWVGLWGMVYTYLPGVLVCYMQLIKRQAPVRLPGWMKAWMDGRKQLGLLSLAAVLLHLLLSTFLWMPSYYSKLWDNTGTVITPAVNGTSMDDKFGLMKGNVATGGSNLQVLMPPGNLTNVYSINKTTIAAPAAGPTLLTANSSSSSTAAGNVPLVVLSAVSKVITLRSKLNWIGEASMFLGIISGFLMGLIAITSVPCVTPKMNWREWRLLQSQSGWLAVITATVHVILLGAPAWPKYRTEWPAMIPTITLMSTIPAMILLLLKGVIALPPMSMVLRRIRSGAWARKGSGGAASMAIYAVKHL